MKYQAVYKCRLCREQYVAGEAMNKKVCFDTLLYIVSRDPQKTIKSSFEQQDIHTCDDGSYSLADFYGFKAVEE